MRKILIFVAFAVAPLSASADGFGFQTPSGNIYCNGWVSDGGAISCQIVNRTGHSPLPQPQSCNGIWGHSFFVEGTGSAGMVCDRSFPQRVDYTDIADYGRSAEFGDISCQSETAGLTCRNKAGHGFKLSRHEQVLFQGQPQSAPTVPGVATATARWSSEFGQGVRDAGIGDGTSSLRVICSFFTDFVNSGMRLDLDARSVFGVAKLVFSDGSTFRADFVDGKMRIASARDVALFQSIVASLKSAGSVTVSAEGYGDQVFSLRGSSRAIGQCPEPAVRPSVEGDETMLQAQNEGVSTVLPTFEFAAPVTNENEPAQTVPLFHIAPAADEPVMQSAGIAPNSAIAPSFETERHTNDKGYVHHRLAECPYELGLAVAQYRFRTTDPTNRVLLELTDVCFDRENGRLFGAEPEHRLTLVRKDEVNETSPYGQEVFEVLVPDTQAYQRWSLNTSAYEVYGQEERQGSVGFDFNKDGQSHNNWAQPAKQHEAQVRLNGYFFEVLPDALPDPSQYLIYINVLDLKSHLRQAEYGNGEQPIVSWKGVIDPAGPNLTAKFVTTESYEAYSKAEGEMTMAMREDGTITGFGVLTAQNARLAGVNPNDWKSVRYDIETLSGHIVGRKGQEIRAVGIVRGERLDQDGLTSPVYGYVSIHGYSRQVVEAWQDEVSLSFMRDFDETENTDRAQLRRAEELLDFLGFVAGGVDDNAGEKTRKAIRRFQAAFGLPEQDTLSPEQMDLLEAMAHARKAAAKE